MSLDGWLPGIGGIFKQVARDRLGDMLVAVDYAPLAIIIPPKAQEEEGMDGDNCFKTCAIARTADVTRVESLSAYTHHTLHYVTHDFEYCVHHFDDTIRKMPLTADLHSHIKEVFRTALLLDNHSFASQVDWDIRS